jgi:hypothetical protein
MALRPSGRDDSNPFASLRKNYVEKRSFVHAEEVEPFLAVVVMIVDPFDRERIAQRRRRVPE